MSFIKRKKKVCKVCLTEQYIYARGLCRKCYRPPGKRLQSKQKKDKPAYGFDSQKSLFIALWVRSDKKCMISGRPLQEFWDTERFWSCFAHVLPKGAYPNYKLNPENIWIVHPDIHALYDQGTEKQREESGYDFAPLFAYKEALKQKYRNEFYKS